MEHEKCGFSLQCSAPPFTHKKTTLLYSAVAFVSFYLSEKLRLILFSFEVEAHHGWEKNFGSISTEVASHAFSIFCSTDESFIRGINPLFFLNSLGSLPFVSSTVKCRMIHRKKLHTTFRSEAGYICIPSAALRESGTKAQVTTEFFATRRPDHRRDIFLIPSDLIRMMKIWCYSTSLFVALWKRNPLECFERHQVSEEVAVYRVFGCGTIEDVTRRQRIPVS